MSEATNYTGGSDYATHPGSPAGRPSRPSKKIHNFGKRSNSIRRNPNAPVIKSNWLYKQDSTGMKLWKKRWFVLCDMCLFYYRDEKEEGILGSILLPSFHISMLSVDDHINRKYAFKATHPNMRTYYFCTDAAKEMESWMKVMTDAALVHSEPAKSRLDRLKVEQCGPQDVNHMANHRPLTRPEIQNNERNREADRERHLAEESRKQRDAERYGFQSAGADRERPLTKINSIKLQPAQAAALTANINSCPSPAARQAEPDGAPRGAPQVNGSGEPSPREVGAPLQRTPTQEPDCSLQRTPTQEPDCSLQRTPTQEPDRSLQRTSSMQQLEQWVRTQRVRNQDDDTRSIMSYQTLPRNMPSHRAPPAVPHYGEGYRTMPRNSMAQRDSICSMSPSVYDQALGLAPGDKRRSMRDDTMWQLFEWQQRQAYVRPPGPYGTLPSPKTMINLSEHATHSIPPSPSHGSLAMYGGYSPLRSYNTVARSEVSSPVYRGDMSIDRRNRTHLTKYAYPPDRRSMPAGIPVQTITAQTLQGKTMSPEDYREHAYMCRPEEVDTDAKLSRLCEQDKVVRTQEDKLQQLHREKHTLETALLSASQEIELGSDNPAAMQSVIQQRDLLQNGLLSTCRELTRVNTELERSWREYDRLEGDVTLAKNNLLEQLEALGSPQTEPPSQQHVHIQQELWRVQDVVEALSKNRAQRSTDGSSHFSSKHKSESPDYRLYKSEPELTTVAEVDESGEDRSEHTSERDPSGIKGMSYPVGIVPPRTKSPMPESSTIASYVTLRKSKKPDPRTERPRSAVEQLCAAESGRSRMSVEEQLERIRRHQQGALREKKKGLNLLGGLGAQQDAPSPSRSPSRSPSFTKENPFRSMQAHSRRREEVMSSDIEALEASMRRQEAGRDIEALEASMRRQEAGRDHETPAQEIARLKEAGQADHFNMDRELSVPDKVLIPERYVEAEPEAALSPQEEADKQKKVDRIKALIARNSMQNALPGELSREEGGEEDSPAQEQDKLINMSYELAAEASKRSKLVAVQSLSSSSPPQLPSSSSPNTPTHPQLTDGSHFMCV